MLLFVEIKLEILRPGKLGSVKNVWHCHKGSPVQEHVAGRDRRHFSQYYYSRKLRLPTIHVYFHGHALAANPECDLDRCRGARPQGLFRRSL
jgi:hypothetical protein